MIAVPLLSILSPLEDVLRNVLEWMHNTVGLPWAWSIVAVTVIVRLILVPLTVKQIHSMQNLQRHAPQMKEIQKKYKQDKKKQQEELMRFYKENQINPAASCLPLLAQFPVFIALYFVLRNFTNHVHATPHELSWLGLINITHHASTGWGPMLLVIYAASQIASTLFMSTTMDKMQRTLLLVLPLVFITFISRFPAGLVLYWVTTNLWTVGQGVVTRRLVPKTPAPALAPKRTSRTKPAEEAPPDTGDGAKPEQPPPKPQPQVRKVRRKKKKRARR
ncbi:MAG TPA: YidC/Oxa1 family membrane protein insertase [Gaiellaceae bacterium]